jgi:hypothetical protein
MRFTYNPFAKRVDGFGTYSITLAGNLSSATGDLNLCRIASNLLTQVPLVTGGTGNTGDMATVAVARHNFGFTWNPIVQPGHFPTDNTYDLAMAVSGEFNRVDTAAQGFCPIQAAYKPSMSVRFVSTDTTIPMRFGGFYTTSQAQNFAADNIGVTPIVFRTATQTQFQFNVTFSSSALLRDGVGVNVTIDADLPGLAASKAEVFYSPSLTDGFRRTVGTIPQITPSHFAGTVRVPYLPQGTLPTRGFFVAKPPCGTASN